MMLNIYKQFLQYMPYMTPFYNLHEYFYINAFINMKSRAGAHLILRVYLTSLISVMCGQKVKVIYFRNSMAVSANLK